MSKKSQAHFPKRPTPPGASRPEVATTTSSTGWVRSTLTAELLSDAHPGSGSGGGGIDTLVTRDRHGRPVIWASHLEGVLRDAARRLRGDTTADDFFGRAGGARQRAVFTSLYAETNPERRTWRSTARAAFDNRAPKDDTLRRVECIPKGTKLVAEVELPTDQRPLLERLLLEVDALGGGRSSGAGRVHLSLSERPAERRSLGPATARLLLLLKNRDPLCITATATPDNLIPSLAFIPGRAMLGSLAAWLIAEDQRDNATLLTSGCIVVSDALPLPSAPRDLELAEVLPAPLSLKSEKPGGSAGDLPWWAQDEVATRRVDALEPEARTEGTPTARKLKRPDDDLFVYREDRGAPWIAFRPTLGVRLRNGRPEPRQPEPSLFSIEQIAERTHFLCELRGKPENLDRLAQALAPVLTGQRWLRVGRGGAPVEVVDLAWTGDPACAQVESSARLTLTSDLLVRDKLLRWHTSVDAGVLQALPGFPPDVQFGRDDQDSVMIHGFNGTARTWRMPAAAVRRGSVFEVSGRGVAQLAQMASHGQWLGERTHEGFGRFRVDAVLPGVTDRGLAATGVPTVPDAEDEAVAATTQGWFEQHRTLAPNGGGDSRTPSLSQWFDLVSALEAKLDNALTSRLKPTTAGGQSWKHGEAQAILGKLDSLQAPQRELHARFFVRWLRAAMRKERT